MAWMAYAYPKFKISLTQKDMVVGPFVLGSSISTVISYLMQQDEKQMSFPMSSFYYNKVDPMSMDFVVELSNCGVHLRFNPIIQKLTSVSFTQMEEVHLTTSYGTDPNYSFSKPPNIATLETIYQVFGPTTGGHFEDNFTRYVLEYSGQSPGLAFVFNVPSEQAQYYSSRAKAHGNEVTEELRREDHKLLILGALYCRQKDPELQIHSQQAAIESIDKGPYVQIDVGEGITLAFPYEDSQSEQFAYIPFGSTVQRVVGCLGLPKHKFTRPPTIVRQDRKEYSSSTLIPEADYFFNYFDLGLDILFDGNLHVVKKFILWTNIPSHPDFLRYSKCHYKMELFKPHVDDAQQPRDHNLLQHRDDEQEERLGNPLDEPLIPETLITPQMKWPQINAIMGDPTGRPLKYPSGGKHGGMATAYAFPNIIFEVMEDDYVSKVILFKS